MIYFVGCSYTWGAGLEYEYYHKNEGWDYKEINNHIPPNVWLESSNYKASEYRRKHRFANLVSKEMNMSYEVINQVNGGDNYNTKWLLNNQPLDNGCKVVIIQFTQWQRSCPEYEATLSQRTHPGETIQTESQIDSIVESQINACFSIPTDKGVRCFGIAWNRDMARVLKNKFPEQFIPLYIDGKYYDSWEHTQESEKFNNYTEVNPFKMRLSDTIIGVKDTHLSSVGHKIVADSIVHKLKGRFNNKKILRRNNG